MAHRVHVSSLHVTPSPEDLLPCDSDMQEAGIQPGDVDGIIAARLLQIGFTLGDPKEVSDRPVVGMLYLYRPFGDNPVQHQYVSVLCWYGRFLEAVVEVCSPHPKDPKGKRRIYPVHCSIQRTLEGVLSAVDTTYPLPQP